MDNQSRPEVANYRRKEMDEPTIEQLKAAIKAERKRMAEVQKSVDNWTQIVSDIETGLQVSQPTHSEWKTRYDYQRAYNLSTKQRAGSLKTQLQMVKNGQTPLSEEETSSFTRTDYRHYVKTLTKEKQSLQSEYDSYSRQLDDTSREYHHLQDEIYSVVNDICNEQDSRIKLQEERDRKQGLQPRHHSQFTRKQYRKPRESTVVQSNSRPQSHGRNQTNISAFPKLPPIKKEASTVSSAGTSYLDLYNHRKQNPQSNFPYQPPSGNKSGSKSKTKKKKKNEENQENNGNHSTLPSIGPSVAQTKKAKVKNQEHFKVKNATLGNPNRAPLQMECQPWIGKEVSMVVIDEDRPSKFEKINIHQYDTPTHIVMEKVPPTVVGILKKVPKIYTGNSVQKDMRKKGKSVSFRCEPEIRVFEDF